MCVCVFPFVELSYHLRSDMSAYVKCYAYISIFVYCRHVAIHTAGPRVVFPPSMMKLKVCVSCILVWATEHMAGDQEVISQHST